MTTGEFIKMLQEADPSGELHMRFPEGGEPIFAERKPGYWDGPYKYINKEGKYVHTSKGEKVDIYFIDKWDYIERHFDNKNLENNSWEMFKENLVFDYDNYSVPEQRQERIDGHLKNWMKEYNEYVELMNEIKKQNKNKTK